MTYIDKNKNHHVRNFIIWIIAIVVLISVILNIYLPHLIPSLFNSIVTPFWRTEFSIKSGSLESPSNLLLENENLRTQLAEMITKSEFVDFVNSENSELREMLNISSSSDYIVAPIIKRPPFSFYDEFIVDAGQDKGVSTSSLVFGPGDIPIGRVIDVFDRSSKVILFSSPQEKHEIEIGPSHIPAIATGRGGGQYEADIPRGLGVSLDDFVVSTSLVRPLGRVHFIDSDPALTFEKILFAVPSNVYELRWVKIDLNRSI